MSTPTQIFLFFWKEFISVATWKNERQRRPKEAPTQCHIFSTTLTSVVGNVAGQFSDKLNNRKIIKKSELKFLEFVYFLVPICPDIQFSGKCPSQDANKGHRQQHSVASVATAMIYLSSSIESHCAALTTDRWLHLQTVLHVAGPSVRPPSCPKPQSDILCELSQLFGLFCILSDASSLGCN